MAVLKAKKRNSLRAGQFAMPKQRKYPIPDCSHAANAKARSTQMFKRGRLSSSQKDKIHARANAKLRSC